MNKNMIIDLINRVTFVSTIKTKMEDGEITQHIESRIQMTQPALASASKPILTEAIGFEMVFEKNQNMKIAAVKPHDNPNCVYIVYKEFNSEGDLITGQYDKNGRLISEYSTIVFDWFETMRAFSPCFSAAMNISHGNAVEMHIPHMLAATMRAFQRHPDQFRESIRIYNHLMEQFNAIIENIRCGMANIMKELENQKKKTAEMELMLHQIADMLEERGEHPGVVADIRGTLGVSIEERFPHINAGTPATRHHRRSRKEVDAAKNNAADK